MNKIDKNVVLENNMTNAKCVTFHDLRCRLRNVNDGIRMKFKLKDFFLTPALNVFFKTYGFLPKNLLKIFVQKTLNFYSVSLFEFCLNKFITFKINSLDLVVLN